MPELYERNPNTSCIICSTRVYRKPSQIERNNGNVFCSQRCYGINCRREVPCVICQKPILGSLHKKTCSRTCSNKNRAGIKYKIGRPRDKAQKARHIKLQLLRERGTKCERCDYNKGEILQIHHKNRNKYDNRHENLEIICPNCHYEEHILNK